LIKENSTQKVKISGIRTNKPVKKFFLIIIF
jgi:hypothetical protein